MKSTMQLSGDVCRALASGCAGSAAVRAAGRHSMPARTSHAGPHGVRSDVCSSQTRRFLQAPSSGLQPPARWPAGAARHGSGAAQPRSYAATYGPSSFPYEPPAPHHGSYFEPPPTHGPPHGHAPPEPPLPAPRVRHSPPYSVPALLVRITEDDTVVEHAGSVVVLGDLGESSQVVAGGDVIVWGRLAGRAFAGVGGNRSAIILAQQMVPSQLGIGDVVAVPPDDGTDVPLPVPEVALVDDLTGQITVVPATKLSATMRWQRPFLPGAVQPALGELSHAGRAALFTGAYIAAAGLALLLWPTQLFGLLFNPSIVPVGWIRVGGVLAALFGAYYLGAAHAGERLGMGLGGFYAATVAGRALLSALFALLVATGQVSPGLLVLAAINLAGALNMARALSRAA